MRMRSPNVAIMLAVLAAGLSAHAVSLTNPGLEDGPPDLVGWTTWGNIVWSKSDNPVDWHTGTGSARGMVPEDVEPGYGGIYQDLPAVPGYVYAAGVWLRTAGIANTESYLELEFKDIAGQRVGGFIQSAYATADQPFTYMSVTPAVAPAGTVTVRVHGVVHIENTTDGYEWHLWDDFYFYDQTDLIPEPATAALFGAAALGLVLARRRRLAQT